MILEEILSQWGCRPVAVPGAVEALAIMDRAADRGEPFPLVLLDRMMPGMDGCELARRLRSDPRHTDSRLMMLTSGGTDEACRSPELGIGAWLAKPVRQSELLEAILDLVGPEPATAQPESVAPAIPSPARRLRVLLAEDHPINQKVATRMLQEQGHEVTVVGNGRQALEAIASGPFDAVLMDVAMPELDGFEALEAIRHRERLDGSHLPIVALTAHAMEGDRERCLAAGFDDYLSKPVQAASLAKALARVVGPTQDASTVPDDRDRLDDRPAFDLDEALRDLAGDEDLFREILGVFLEEAPRLLAEVRLAAEGGDAPSLRRLGHILAGTAGHFAAPELVDSGRKLEAIGKSGELADAENAAREFGKAFERFRRAVDASRFAPESSGLAPA